MRVCASWVQDAAGWGHALERDILHWLTCRVDTPWVRAIFEAVQDKRLSVPLFLGLLGVVAWVNWRHALRATGAAAAGFGLSMALASLLWATVDRDRPPHHYDTWLVTPETQATCAAEPDTSLALHHFASKRPSFPSRHGMTVGAFTMAVFLAWRPAGWLALLYGVIVLLGRVHVARHWPSDLIVGATCGVLAAWFAWRLWPAFVAPLRMRSWVEDPRERADAHGDGTRG